MVAQSDLVKANQLNTEYNSITAALKSFDDGGTILAMSIGTLPPDTPPGMGMAFGVQVDTGYMFEHVPPQMIDSIKSLMIARQAAIAGELQNMGVTVTQPRRK